jgi:succinate-semialdehyde dehydrogenase/glutarate-semialdehyde dehydrogenase
MYPKLSLYIDGQFIGAEGRREQDVYNPATGEVIGKLPHATREDLVQQVKAEQRTKPVVRRAPKPDGTPVAKAAPAALDETEDGAATDAPKKRRRRRRKPGGAEGSASAGQD